jgi:Zn-dependent protease with chaperone function
MDLLINGLNALYGIKHEESSDDKKEDNTAVVAAVPFAPLVIVILNTIGIINNIFSRLIQASFSIESIRAADAIAVRFTRNIDGLKGALLQGVVQKNKTKITSVDASDYEHSLFSSCSKESDLYGFILKTHPNIKTRIKTLDSKWDGSLPKARKSSTEEKVSIKESENDKKTS